MGKINGKDYLIETYSRGEGIHSISRTKLIEDHHYLVGQIAKGMKRKFFWNVKLEELESDGALGLIDAVDKYDVSRRVIFRTYARYRIRGSILDESRLRSPLSRSMLVKMKLFDKAYSVLASEFRREPKMEEILGELAKDDYVFNSGCRLEGIPKAEKIYEDVTNGEICIYSLDSVPKTDKNQKVAGSFLEVIAGNNPSPFSKLSFEGILDGLSEREKDVARLYYDENKTLREVGEVLGLTESRICQIHTPMIKKIRKRFNKIGQDYEEGLKIVCK